MTERRYKLAIMTTHPIQYQVPWFRLLAAEPNVDLTVFFGMLPDATQQGDGFGVAFEWDVPLLAGFRYQVLDNVAATPSVTQFKGCDTPSVKQIIREGDWDAVIVNGWVSKMCLQALWACRRYGVPCLTRGTSNALKPRAWWQRLAHRVLLSQFAGFLVLGETNRRFLQQSGVPARKLFWAPHAVNNDYFLAQAAHWQPQRDALRQKFGIPDNAVSFVFSGKLEAKKRPLDVLHALKIALTHVRAETIHLLLVGDGALRAACEQLIATHQLPVTMTGFLNQGEITQAYVAADCLVLPSDYGETWGLVVNEAMLCGRTAIGSDHIGCHEDLLAKDTGLVFPFGDQNALADCFVTLVNDRAKLAAMSARAQALIADYSPEKVKTGCMRALVQLVKVSGLNKQVK